MKAKLCLVLAILAACATLANSSARAQETSSETSPGTRPNIVFVLTDDQDEVSLRHMSNLQSLLVDGGKTFENAINVYPLCCPSRAAIQRGQYAHNTGVFGNGRENGGGWYTFHRNGLHRSIMGTWADGAGYETGYFGKFMNGYDGSGLEDNLLPGYDRQFVTIFGADKALDQGELVDLPQKDEDRVVSEKALGYVREKVPEETPFFLTASFFAPHLPASHEDRFAGMFKDQRVPRDPNYNVKPDPNDPKWVKQRPKLTREQKREYDEIHRDRLRSLQTVDEFVAKLYEALGEEAENTYVVYYTDNGFHLGDHRLPAGKLTPYEEDTGFPLILRGPSVPAGTTDQRLVGNHDIAPTIADIAGATPPEFVDGRSILPVATAEPEEEVQWRTAILSERRIVGKPGGLDGARYIPEWQMVRRQYSTYIRTKDYPGTKRYDPDFEYYNLLEDPYQLRNRAGTLRPGTFRKLQDRLAALRNCSGEECRVAENGP